MYVPSFPSVESMQDIQKRQSSGKSPFMTALFRSLYNQEIRIYEMLEEYVEWEMWQLNSMYGYGYIGRK